MFHRLTANAFIECEEDAKGDTWTATLWYDGRGNGPDGTQKRNYAQVIETFPDHDAALKGFRRLVRFYTMIVQDGPCEGNHEGA